MGKSIVERAREEYEPGCPYEIPIPETSLYDLLADTARRYPTHIALDYFGAVTTYENIRTQVLQAAQVLVDAGVKKGDVVAISLPNCPQAFIAFYACMRIGAVAAEHNPLAPASEIHGQLRRHKGKIAIVWEKSVSSFPIDGTTKLETVFTVDITAGLPRTKRALLRLPVSKARDIRSSMRGYVPETSSSWDRAVSRASTLPPSFPHASGDDTAVILHTGGTNGAPKSVPLTHKNIGANVNQCIFWVWKLRDASETFFSLLPYFHAFGLTFFLCASVKKAATQIVLPKFDADMALDAHTHRPVTFFVGVPPMFEGIMNRAKERGIDISSIRWAVSGAMPLSAESASRWEEATGGIIIEGYGLSETSPVISGAPMSPSRRHGVLGIPFASTQLRLVDVDDSSRDVEDGEPGEIIVKGPQVFHGYLDMPEENERVFTEDGWFKTGDIGVHSDGYIIMTDRKKELILSGGFNVYPSQVEEAIRSLPGIRDVAVVGMPIADAREEVTAALIMAEGTARATLQDVREWAERTIPHYALPRRIAFIREMPRNQLGKIQRRLVKAKLLAEEETDEEQP